jgi:hypothetical protein
MRRAELVNPDTVFQLASLSKPLFSTIISSLVTDGTVKWDDIAKHSKPLVPNRPPLNLAAYVGTYRNDYVGRVKIAVDNGSLLLTRCVRQAPLPLRHWDGNTFLSYLFPDTPGLPALVEFKLDAGGEPSRIQLEEFAGNGEGTDSVARTE